MSNGLYVKLYHATNSDITPVVAYNRKSKILNICEGIR